MPKKTIKPAGPLPISWVLRKIVGEEQTVTATNLEITAKQYYHLDHNSDGSVKKKAAYQYNSDEATRNAIIQKTIAQVKNTGKVTVAGEKYAVTPTPKAVTEGTAVTEFDVVEAYKDREYTGFELSKITTYARIAYLNKQLGKAERVKNGVIETWVGQILAGVSTVADLTGLQPEIAAEVLKRLPAGSKPKPALKSNWR